MKQRYFFLTGLILLSINLYSLDIWQAIGSGDLEQVKKFIEIAEVDINSYYGEDGKKSNTLLSCAASLNHYDIVSYLLSKKANVNTIVEKSRYGRKDGTNTALNCAIQIGSYEIVKLLVENGADIRILTEDGFGETQTVLDEAFNLIFKTYSGELDSNVVNKIKVFKYLIEVNKKIKNPLSNITLKKRESEYFIINDDVQSLKSLIKKGVFPDVYTIQYAIYANSPAIINYLYDIGVIDKKNIDDLISISQYGTIEPLTRMVRKIDNMPKIDENIVNLLKEIRNKIIPLKVEIDETSDFIKEE